MALNLIGTNRSYGSSPAERPAPAEAEPASRGEAFERLALARARGEAVALPRYLPPGDRRLHVRQTLREDHRERITHRVKGAQDKFQALADSVYDFFRGTCLLFYRDMAGDDAWMPTVLALGDVHPGNYGVMPSADNVPIFGVNDFDEAYYAPFTWDLKRGAVGFMLGAAEKGGYGHKVQRKAAKHFLRGYIAGIEDYARTHSARDYQVRQDNAPPLIAQLFKEATAQSRSEWLADDYHDEHRSGFRANDELVPVSSRRQEFQERMHRFVRENAIEVPARARGMRVKDVAQRKGAGTASLGLIRYYVMIEGPHRDGSDDIILELKQARRSALAGLVPPSEFRHDGTADRIVHAQGAHLVEGDLFYGHLDIDGVPFLTRERAPFRDSVDLDELNKKQWREYARICGLSLAQAHALSDDAGDVDRAVEPVILEAMGPRDLFIDDILRFAEDAVERIRADHATFCKDHALGAFRSVDQVYR